MKICPNCSNVCKDTDDYCPECNKPIIEYDFEDDEDLFTPKVFDSDSNQNGELKKTNVINDPPMSVINQQKVWKQSATKQKQEENRRKKEDIKFKVKTVFWVLGLIILNVLFQLIGYYGNYDYYTGFEFNWSACIGGSVLYCVATLLISIFSDWAKNPEYYEAVNKANQQARQKKIAEIKRQAEEDKKFKPKCPTCGCENVRRISSTERGVNAVVFGIYGTKRKCQFECQNPNCKYRW